MNKHIDITIEIENVEMQFGDEKILKGISHEFERGKIHGIIGHNGSGKTVLFKCICGFLIPTKGRIFVDYEQIGKDIDFPQDLGLIIETPGFLPRMNGFKNLKLLASLRRKINDTQIKDILLQVGLDPNSSKGVGQYSLGMRQRLGLAQALMEEPSLLVLDEPFNGLDKQSLNEMRSLIKNYITPQRTILMASHNPEDIDMLCDTVCQIDGGRLTQIR